LSVLEKLEEILRKWFAMLKKKRESGCALIFNAISGFLFKKVSNTVSKHIIICCNFKNKEKF